jgi:hypothetical protein
MKLVFLPHVREGIVPTATAGVRAQASVGVRLESPGRQARDVSRAMTLLGPGDVVSIDPRQVLRVTPSSGTRDAEPEFFPSIEFDAPELPWSYSPLVPSGTRVLPWITLIVIEATSEVAIVPGQQGQSPLILRLPPAMASRELPDLADRWAWAHAQVACASTTDVAQTLANHPDRTLSRLLSPRRLLPFRAYIACVVPAFLSGRIAGLGRDPATEPTLVTGHEPAWSPSDVPSELPVYYSWSFRTGEAGDFESLAQRLQPRHLMHRSQQHRCIYRCRMVTRRWSLIGNHRYESVGSSHRGRAAPPQPCNRSRACWLRAVRLDVCWVRRTSADRGSTAAR